MKKARDRERMQKKRQIQETELSLLEAYRSAFSKPGMMVYLDGRNEHGTHVLPMLPMNAPDEVAGELFTDEGPNEVIFLAAENEGFKAGDCVWTVWHFEKAQLGEYGRVELAEYWEFVGINAEASRALSLPPKPST